MTGPPATPERGIERYCGGPKRQGEGTCTRPAGWGTNHVGFGRCKLHGGSTPNHETHWRRILNERRIRSDLGAILAELEADGIDRDPLDVLAEQVARANAMVIALGTLVGELPMAGADFDEQVGPDGPIVVVAPGLYGPDHQGDGKPHVLVAMYGEWMDRAGRLSKLAKDVGLQERRVALDEEMASLVESAMRSALGALLERIEGGADIAVLRREVPALIAGALESTAREA